MPVTLEQIQTIVGRSLTKAESAQAQMWIPDARLVISRGPEGRDRIDLNRLDQDVLDMVVREAVADRIKRPDDATEVQVSVDDGSVARRYSSSAGQIRIRPEWWTMLLPAAAPDAFSIVPAYEPDLPSPAYEPGPGLIYGPGYHNLRPHDPHAW